MDASQLAHAGDAMTVNSRWMHAGRLPHPYSPGPGRWCTGCGCGKDGYQHAEPSPLTCFTDDEPVPAGRPQDPDLLAAGVAFCRDECADDYAQQWAEQHYQPR